ncbi:MAG: isoamylase early set domain-containing protein [Proteobacteria bacterium]|nr:glycoside hydrolase [Desulfobacula sp.]MBU3953379.1 isoamylase early set domain-containing protein [Pseudomonadota bacterium]MBU4132585.1 isoamylase early set domain-containing protein [Pseudomonadota bacterium]
MSIKKQYLKTRPICKTTFRLSTEEARNAKHVSIVGEFNNWNKTANPMKPLKDGGFVATLDLETGREYQFRYCFDRIAWGNDPGADTYLYSSYGNCENSMIRI